MVKSLFVSFLFTFFAVAPHTLVAQNAFENIGKTVSILEDPDNSFSLEQVVRMGSAGKFVNSTQSILNLGNSSAAFWIKIRYQNPGEQNAYLIVDVPNIEHIDFYTKSGRGGVIHHHTGSLSAPTRGVSATNRYIFDLPTTSATPEGKDVYLKVRSNNVMLVSLKIADAKTLVSSGSFKLVMESLYSGILLMLFIFNIFLFISIRDKTYLYYSIYIAALSIYVVLYLRGYSYIFGPDVRSLINLYPHVFASIATIAAFFFSWEFLGIKTRVPKMVPVYKVMIGIWIGLLIIALFGGKSILALAVNYLTMISCLIACYAGLCAYRNGLKPALYFLIAWLVVGLSFVVALLGITNVIPYYDLSYEVGPIGTTIEMLFLSFALGDRFNHISQEKKRIEKESLQLVLSHNEKLESVVKERTLKLTKANAEKDKLFSIIAHDLRSPFNSLISILELNDNDMLDLDELKDLLQKTRKNVDQMHLTLNNLLYWAKGQMEMAGSTPENFNLQTMIERLALVYQPLSISKSLKLITSASGSCDVFADMNEIDLVLRNLIDNALKFSPPNSTIEIAMKQQVGKVKISVSNAVLEDSNGKLQTLLHAEQFFSTPGTSNEQGIGLGLHLCREYIQLNKGSMEVLIKDQQVTISFSLPAYQLTG